MSKWDKVRLGDVLLYEQPTKYIVENTDYSNDYKTPVLTPGQTFVLGYTNETNNIYGKNLPCIIFDDFTTAIKFVDFPFKVKSSAMKILNNDKTLTDIRYLFYYMLTIKIDTELHKRYWISEYSNLFINLPNLNTQKKIADILDKITGLISLRKEQIKKLDLLVKTLFIELFGDPVVNPMGWEVKRLGDITNIGSSKRIFAHEYVDYGIPFYRTKEIVELSQGHLIKNELFISFNRFQTIAEENGYPKFDDLLVSAVGTIGVIWVINTKESFYYKDGNLILINKCDMMHSFVLKMILERLIKEQADHLSAGSAYNALTIVKLKELYIPLPPLALQTHFAEIVQEVDKIKFVMQEGLNKLELTYKALMQQYFD